MTRFIAIRVQSVNVRFLRTSWSILCTISLLFAASTFVVSIEDAPELQYLKARISSKWSYVFQDG
jgi:hypothetical protein